MDAQGHHCGLCNGGIDTRPLQLLYDQSGTGAHRGYGNLKDWSRSIHLIQFSPRLDCGDRTRDVVVVEGYGYGTPSSLGNPLRRGTKAFWLLGIYQGEGGNLVPGNGAAIN
jgi:hypothetical protein